MPNLDSSAESFRQTLSTLSSSERYEQLKRLDGNELFWELTALDPGMLQEFLKMEKLDYIKSVLCEQVSPDTLRCDPNISNESLGPTTLADLVRLHSEGGELWRFDETPGDKGYAIVRSGRVAAFCVCETSNSI